MTFEQIALLALLVGLMATFALDRWRVEVVALAGLAAAFLLGLVPDEAVFAGFANPAVITVVEILIIADVIGHSRAVDALARRLTGAALGDTAMVSLLCGVAAAISIFINNVGALALMLPIAYSVSAAGRLPLRSLLLPISFATLLGGLCSLIGTPANLIVSGVAAQATGTGFNFFAFAPVGLVLSVFGILWLSLAGWRMLLRRGDEAPGDRHYPTDLFLTEVVIPPGSGLVGSRVRDVERDDKVSVHGVFREDARVFARKEGQVLAENDLLLLSGTVESIRAFLRRHGLRPAVADSPSAVPADRAWVEIVVVPQSTIIGSAVGAIAAFMKRDIQVVAISPQGSRIEGRLGDVAPVVGDILLLRGARSDIADALRDTQSVPIATQALLFGGSDAAMPLIVFGGSIVLAATGILPTAIAFGGAVLLMALTGVLNLRNALRDLNWPVIIMLAAMLPIGEALATTGTAELIARSALGVLGPTSEIVLVAGMLLVAVIITPFLNNVTTAILLAPIAVAVGAQSGIPPEPLLVAVAVGASTDFLTPFGHHNNTLVMGLGHYRFGDFPRVGAPLTLLVLVTAPPIIIALF